MKQNTRPDNTTENGLAGQKIYNNSPVNEHSMALSAMYRLQGRIDDAYRERVVGFGPGTKREKVSYR
jgi:hypothetical protein